MRLFELEQPAVGDILEIAKEVNLSNDMVKKWLKKEWTLQ